MPARPFTHDIAQADGRMDRDGEHEQQVEGEEPDVLARAAEHCLGGEPGPHGIEDGRKMHRHRKGQHSRRDALRGK